MCASIIYVINMLQFNVAVVVTNQLSIDGKNSLTRFIAPHGGEAMENNPATKLYFSKYIGLIRFLEVYTPDGFKERAVISLDEGRINDVVKL